MIQPSLLFAKQILSLGNFKVTALPRSTIRALLTAFDETLRSEVVIIKPLLKLAQSCSQGVLVIDDTTNPKYGLKQWARKLKIVGTSGYANGYKILLFLWESNLGRIPIGFALWHKASCSINELALKGLSRLRNQHALKPKAVLADGAFSTDKMLKRLEDYGWPTVMRFKGNRRLGGAQLKKEIARGYGSTEGRLKNGVKLKVFRRKSRFFVCNRMLWSMQKAIGLYKMRWKVEEVFRVLKSCLGLKRCQQHSMQAQVLYVLLLFILFACLEIVSGGNVYQAAQAIISERFHAEDILLPDLFNPC